MNLRPEDLKGKLLSLGEFKNYEFWASPQLATVLNPFPSYDIDSSGRKDSFIEVTNIHFKNSFSGNPQLVLEIKDFPPAYTLFSDGDFYLNGVPIYIDSKLIEAESSPAKTWFKNLNLVAKFKTLFYIILAIVIIYILNKISKFLK